MAIRPIQILGAPGDEVLRQVAAPVDAIDGSIQALIDDMIETMRDAPGVGLAAPQLRVLLRIVVIEVPEVPAFALINGEVMRHSGERWVDEGCLSIPGYRADVLRFVKVTVKGVDRYGRRVRIRAVDDVLAQALEHEIDHTNGLLYVDRLSGIEHLHRVIEEDDGEVEPRVTGSADPSVRTRRRGGPPRLVRAKHRLRTPIRSG